MWPDPCRAYLPGIGDLQAFAEPATLLSRRSAGSPREVRMLVLPLRGFAVHFVVVSCLLFVVPPPLRLGASGARH